MTGRGAECWGLDYLDCDGRRRDNDGDCGPFEALTGREPHWIGMRYRFRWMVLR